MSDRLSELARQRALVLEHLAWLDREIARANARPSLPLVAPPPPAAGVVLAAPAPLAAVAVPAAGRTAPAATGEPDVILDQYRVAPAALKQDLRKGCFLYFAGAFVVLGIIVVILYFAIGTR